MTSKLNIQLFLLHRSFSPDCRFWVGSMSVSSTNIVSIREFIKKLQGPAVLVMIDPEIIKLEPIGDTVDRERRVCRAEGIG